MYMHMHVHPHILLRTILLDSAHQECFNEQQGALTTKNADLKVKKNYPKGNCQKNIFLHLSDLLSS